MLGPGENFPANTILVVVPHSGAKGFKIGVPSGAHGASYRGIRKMITLMPQVYEEHYTTLMHEIGHCFGSDELYPSGPPLQHEVGGYDVMGDIVYATGFMGWHRFRYGWLDRSHILFLHNKGKYEIDLRTLSAPSGKAMIVIPDQKNPMKYWVIEIGGDVVSRTQFKAGKDEKLNVEGDRLIVYTVQDPAKPGKRAIRLVPRDGNSGDHGTTQWLDRVSYKEGQKLTGEELPFALSVDSKSNYGFSITVTLDSDIPVK